MAPELTRIISDVHYGDRASRVRKLAQLRPLLEGVTHLVLNGDTLDTRPGPDPGYTAGCRTEVKAFFSDVVARATFLTGNHDPDFSPHHALDLAAGRVFVTHGDIVFDNIVPWSRDAAAIGQRIAAGLNQLRPDLREDLEHRLVVWRQVAASIPQRHQSERHRLKFALRYAADTIWPPLRIVHLLRSWRIEPVRAADLARRHRPLARFVLTGHMHRPGIRRSPEGIVVINTGTFCPPFGAYAVDIAPAHLAVREVVQRAGEFSPGRVLAEFPLAGT